MTLFILVEILEGGEYYKPFVTACCERNLKFEMNWLSFYEGFNSSLHKCLESIYPNPRKIPLPGELP